MKILFFILLLCAKQTLIASVDEKSFLSSSLEVRQEIASFGIQDFRFTTGDAHFEVSKKRPYGYQWYELAGGLYNRLTKSNGKTTGDRLKEITGVSPASFNFFDKLGSILNPWYGLCNGVSNLNLVANLPREDISIKAINGDWITLSPEDIHGIASLGMMSISESAEALGNRKEDLNPGIFHLALTRSDNRNGLIISAAKDGVNNLPVYSYKVNSFFDGSEEYNGKRLKIIKIRGQIEVAVKAKRIEHSLLDYQSKYEDIAYDLYVDPETTEILGGVWTSKYRPRIMWKPVCRKFQGQFSFLNDILDWECK